MRQHKLSQSLREMNEQPISVCAVTTGAQFEKTARLIIALTPIRPFTVLENDIRDKMGRWQYYLGQL